jgi:broad specificity phosphatase PhoE
VPADEPATGTLPDWSRFLGRAGTVLTSPARRCSVPGAAVDERLRPWDLGAWVGQDLAALDLAAWRGDPGYDAHGGESLLALRDRVAGLLSDWHSRFDQGDRLVAVTHAAVVKAAVVHALQAPVQATWDLDVAPSSTTELHATPTGWRVVGVNR